MKRLFSMIAAPIMALFAGANAATPADSVTDVTPAAVVQEATPEQAPQAPNGEDAALQDMGTSGKVVSIDGSTVTLALAERPELPADGQQPPEKPADDENTPAPADGEAPAKPENGQQPADGQQPPEKPADDENAPADGEAPAKPKGAPADDRQPADGEAPAKPEGDMPELTFSDETVTYDLSNAVVTVEDNGTVSDGDLSDITVDSVLLLKVDENGTVTEVTVLVQG